MFSQSAVFFSIDFTVGAFFENSLKNILSQRMTHMRMRTLKFHCRRDCPEEWLKSSKRTAIFVHRTVLKRDVGSKTNYLEYQILILSKSGHLHASQTIFDWRQLPKTFLRTVGGHFSSCARPRSFFQLPKSVQNGVNPFNQSPKNFFNLGNFVFDPAFDDESLNCFDVYKADDPQQKTV